MHYDSLLNATCARNKLDYYCSMHSFNKQEYLMILQRKIRDQGKKRALIFFLRYHTRQTLQ